MNDSSAVPLKCCVCLHDIEPGITLFWDGRPAHPQCVQIKQAESMPVSQSTIDFWRLKLVAAEETIHYYQKLVKKRFGADLSLVSPGLDPAFVVNAVLQAGEKLDSVASKLLEGEEVPENRIESASMQAERAISRCDMLPRSYLDIETNTEYRALETLLDKAEDLVEANDVAFLFKAEERSMLKTRLDAFRVALADFISKRGAK